MASTHPGMTPRSDTWAEALVPIIVVLAATVRAGAHAILTENVKHFPAECLEAYNIDVLTPDQFLAHQFHLDRELLEEKLCGQAKARGIPYDALVRQPGNWRRRCQHCSWNPGS